MKDITDIIDTLEKLLLLDENWNGQGSIPLRIKSSSNIMILYYFMGENIFGSIDDITCNSNGTATLIWKNSKDEIVNVEVGDIKISYYTSISNEDTLYFNDVDINEEEIDKISNFIKKLKITNG